MPETKEKPKPAKAAGTGYIVLQVHISGEEDENQSMTVLGSAVANNGDAAISALLGDEPEPGSYIAIPQRSFQIRRVSVATSTKVNISDN